MATITVDPVSRIEGHLKVVVDDTATPGTIVTAKFSSQLFRGFENILKRRDPRDAPVITQRI